MVPALALANFDLLQDVLFAPFQEEEQPLFLLDLFLASAVARSPRLLSLLRVVVAGLNAEGLLADFMASLLRQSLVLDHHLAQAPHPHNAVQAREFGQRLVNSDELVPVGHFLDDEDFLGLVVLVQVDDGAASAQRLQLRELVEAVEGQAAHFVVRHRHL